MRFSPIFSLLAVVAASAALPSEAVTTTRDLTVVDYHRIVNEHSRLSAAEGAPDGLYIVHNATHAAYYGEVTAELLTHVDRITARDAAAVTCDVSCNGQQHGAGDISAAENGLKGFFGSGLSWSGHIFYLFNSVYAFACDYGHGQDTTATAYSQSITCVDAQCSNTQGGWNSIHSAKITLGREIGSFGC